MGNVYFLILQRKYLIDETRNHSLPDGCCGHGWVVPGEAAVGHHAPGRRVVPVRAVGGRRLAHRHLRHGPDLWLAGDECMLLLL